MRHPTRHAHKTLADHVKSQLKTLGWITPPINYGSTPVTFMELAPARSGTPISPNTVGVSLGDSSPLVEAELGGGLLRTTVALFVDVYAQDWSTAAAICDDVALILTNLRLAINDYSLDPVEASSAYMEIDEVDIDEPPAAVELERQHWMVVTADLELYLPA